MKKLGFGLMRLPLKNAEDQTSVDTAALNEMVDAFLQKGFTYFDTAYMYHDYKSEELIRKALVKRYPRNCFTLASKLPTMFLKKQEDQERIFQEQLTKCGVDFFDYYLLHNLGAENYKIAEKMNSFEFIMQKKKQGKVKHIGFSYHDDAKLLDEILSAHPEVEFVQLQINYIDWDNKSIQSGKCYEVACKHEKPVIVMEPVKGGTLANVPPAAKELFLQANPSLSIASWAIRFAASLDNVMMVLSGMSNMKQLLDNTSYMQNFKPLSNSERHIIEQAVKIINESISISCTSCEYCVAGCPKGIAIPKYFALYNAEIQALNQGFSTQQTYYDNYVKTYAKASECIGCKRCETSCPQHLPIIEHLKLVSKMFERK